MGEIGAENERVPEGSVRRGASAADARPTRRWPFALFLVIVLAYTLFRVGLFVMTQTGAVKPDHPLDPLVNGLVVYSELAIGLLGLAAFPGLLRSWPWSFWLTVAVNAYAIVFDAVSAVGVQVSAAGGTIPPVVILRVLALFRKRFFHGEAVPVRGSVTHA